MPLLEPAALLRLDKIRRCLAQNLIGLAKLAILMLQRLHLFALGGGQALPQIPVMLGLAHPVAQRLRRAADLAGDRLSRPTVRHAQPGVRTPPDRSLTDLG